MAWTRSGLAVATFVDALDTTQLALDLDLETHKLALYDNTLTPNFLTDSAYSATGEMPTSGSYVAGGFVLTTTTFLGTGGTGVSSASFAAANWSQAIAVTSTYGCKIYADALVGDNLIAMIYFGAAFTSTGAGPFAINWSGGNVFTWTMA